MCDNNFEKSAIRVEYSAFHAMSFFSNFFSTTQFADFWWA